MRDTNEQEMATSPSRRTKMKTALRKASGLVSLTVDLYREMTLSALRLLPHRR
jgi:hypothetical protein